MKMGFWRTKTPIFPADPRERDELWHPLVNTPSIWAGKSSWPCRQIHWIFVFTQKKSHLNEWVNT